MSLFGVELNQQTDKIITEIRLNLQKQKFIPNLRTIYRSLAQFDQNISGVLPPHLFEKALNQNGIFFKKVELTILQKSFEAPNGQISWFQFLQVLKIPLNQKRKELLLRIYAFISEQHQQLTPNNLIQHFDPSDIELVKSKKLSVEAAQEQIISLLFFKDGQLSEEEFVAFYDDLSLNFPHDEPFLKYVSRQWGFSGQSQVQVRQEDLRSIIRALRFKLIQKSKGTNDEFLMRKLFNEFDENKNGYICAFELDLMLKTLELPITAEQVEPLLRKLDKNQSGFIEYDQFKKFIFFDPYPA